MVISINRLKANCSHFAAYVETPAPNIIMRLQTSERTLTSAWTHTLELTATRD
jgi:hypothetical protein